MQLHHLVFLCLYRLLTSGVSLLKQIAVWFCVVLPLTQRSTGVMGSQPERYNSSRTSAVIEISSGLLVVPFV